MKEKIKKFYLKYNNYSGIIIIFILLVGFFYYFGFTKECFNNLFYGYLIIFIIYTLIFQLDLFEKLITKKFTIILISGITFILYFQAPLGINHKDVLLMIGGIIAFWYGYKRYERDKDIEMIDKYLIGKLSAENMEEIKKWRISFLLNEEGYIKKWIWDEINQENGKIFLKFLQNNFIIKTEEEKKKLNSAVEKITNMFFPNQQFKTYILKYLEKLVEEINVTLKREYTKEDENFSKNINALISSINEVDKKYNI